MAQDSRRLEAEGPGPVLVADAQAEVEVFSSFASLKVLVEAAELSHDGGPKRAVGGGKGVHGPGPGWAGLRVPDQVTREPVNDARARGQVDLERLERVVAFEISVEIPITGRGQSAPAHSYNSLAEPVEQAFRPLRFGLAVIVQSGDDRCPGRRDPSIAGCSKATVDGMANDVRAVGRCHFRTVVGRAVVDDDQLELVSEGLPPNGGQAPVQPRCSIQRAKDDTDAESVNIG
jgi:hypothetical protein